MDELPAAEAIDPSGAKTPQEFGALLKELFDCHGMSANNVAEKAQVSSSTVSALVNGRGTARPETFKTILATFKLSEPTLSRWHKKRSELLRKQGEDGQQDLMRRIEAMEVELNGANANIASLRVQETELRAELAAEQERASKLEGDRAQANEKIQALAEQLERVREKKRKAHARLKEILAQKESLVAFNELLRGQLELLQEERAQRESAERSIQQLKAQVSEIGQAYSVLRAATLDAEVEEVVERPVTKAPKPEQTKNEPLVTTIAVNDRDFGKPYEFWITFPWYCENCKIGGSKQQLVCPNCKGAIVYDEMQLVKLKELPDASYGKTLVVSGVGNWDDLNLKRGDVHIQVRRKESRQRWQ